MINSVYEVCQIICNKENYGALTPQRFNKLAKNAQIKILSDLIDQLRRSKKDKNNIERLSEIEHTLSVFYQTSTLYRGEVSGVIQDYFELPTDLWIDDDYSYNTDQPITIVPKREIDAYLRSRDMRPSMDNIFGYKYSNKLQLYPTTIGKVGTIKTSDVDLSYYRQPEDPALNYISGVLDPSEPYDFELPLQYHDKLVVEILLGVGIHLREEIIYTYARNERQQETNNENA